MIVFNQRGDFHRLNSFLERIKRPFSASILDKYGRMGVEVLSQATPKDTGKTAASWQYRITDEDGIIKISFLNSNIQNGVNIAIILQYGHATQNGGYVQGIDYINPALRPIFDEIEREAWKEVSRS